MNEEKRKENKKSDKKALMIFIPCLIISFFAGFGFGESASFSMMYQITMGLIAGAGLQQIFSIEEKTEIISERISASSVG